MTLIWTMMQMRVTKPMMSWVKGYQPRLTNQKLRSLLMLTQKSPVLPKDLESNSSLMLLGTSSPRPRMSMSASTVGAPSTPMMNAKIPKEQISKRLLCSQGSTWGRKLRLRCWHGTRRWEDERRTGQGWWIQRASRTRHGPNGRIPLVWWQPFDVRSRRSGWTRKILHWWPWYRLWRSNDELRPQRSDSRRHHAWRRWHLESPRFPCSLHRQEHPQTTIQEGRGTDGRLLEDRSQHGLSFFQLQILQRCWIWSRLSIRAAQ